VAPFHMHVSPFSVSRPLCFLAARSREPLAGGLPRSANGLTRELSPLILESVRPHVQVPRY
jgi:hypothetical protein